MLYAKIQLPVILFLLVSILLSCSSPQVETPVPTVVTEFQTPEPTPTVKTSPPSEPADIIFHNGNIITVEKSQPSAQAVAIRANLIQAVGSDAEILVLAGSNTTVVDLKGKTMMPGIINNHTHYLRNGLDAEIPMDEMMNNFLRFGTTTETEMVSIDEFINTMLEAEKNGKVPIRLNIYGEYNCGGLENGKSIECPSWYLDHPPILDPERMVRIPGVKIFMDGAGNATRGCHYQSFDFPATVTDVWPDVYETCGTPHGDLYLTEEQLIPVLQDIQDRGYRAAFHAMGDASIEIILNAIKTVLHGESNSIYRHEILHCSLLSPQLIDRFVQMDILAQFGGMFNFSEMDWYKATFGEEHYQWAADRYALPLLGVHVSFGNDYNARVNIKNLNPFRSLWGYVTKKELLDDGTIVEPPQWAAKYKLSVERALEIMTIEGAYALSMEEYTGSILPGKFADLIILSDDPLTIEPDKLLDLNVLMTMVNGEVKYCADGQGVYCPAAGQAATTITPTIAPTTIPTVTKEEVPQTAQVKYDCDVKSTSPSRFTSQQFLLTNINWEASTEEQLNDFLEAVKYSIYVNDRQVQSSLDHGEIKPRAGGQTYSVLVYFDVGKLSPGQNKIRTVLTFEKKIFDGTEYYGPSTKYATIEGTCTMIIE